MKRCLTRGRRRRPAAIDMAPLIDMVFLLLVFYIVTASFTRDSAVSIDRPRSGAAVPVSGGSLAVAVARGGAVYAGGSPAGTSPAARRAAIARALRAQGARRVLVHADRAVPTGTLLAVMDDCRAAGAENVDVAAVRDVSR